MKSILIVDDDKRYLESLKKLLEKDYEITTTIDPKEGIILASNNYYDLIIVDHYMPDVTGEVFVELVSSLSPLQKIFVVSGNANIDDQLKILQNENVDYIDKSVEPIIFMRRIERILCTENKSVVGARKLYSAAEEIELDSFYRIVTVKGNKVNLTTKEYLLLSLFLANKNVVLSRKEIGEVVWSNEDEPGSRSIDVLIVKLRKKINTSLIISRRGIGYVWREK